ncbi:hypothetical protein CASFOL_008981 [Castilleja foliolosa]|uniref:Rapid alkalinization factor n=1 Tax=Castilleja foliolosa TaxID=1961234 RepID=A0ABD3E0I1_9LAMI
MAKFQFIIAAVVVVVAAVLAIADAGEDFSLIQTNYPEATCRGSIAECMADGEYEMDSEIHRRMLVTKNYIGYGALKRDNTLCVHRGSSYYNCNKNGPVNPYNRKCNQVTRCGRGG